MNGKKIGEISRQITRFKKMIGDLQNIIIMCR